MEAPQFRPIDRLRVAPPPTVNAVFFPVVATETGSPFFAIPVLIDMLKV
jgi:hypothetical protein